MIEIIFNGKSLKMEESTSLQDFASKNLPEGKFAIEVDLEVIPKSQYSTFIIQNGMKIEAITFVGGG